jgi:VWFA-related protein
VPANLNLLLIAILTLSLTGPPTQTAPTAKQLDREETNKPTQTAPELSATQPAQAPPDIVFRTTTRLVQVNVVVHDKDGKPVGDLKKEDFSITEKGKPQEIAFFSVDNLDKAPADVPKLPPHIFTNQLAQRAGVPSSVTVILLDSLNTNFADQTHARTAVIDFLLQLKPSDHVAIYRLSSQLQVLHDYTTDAADLIKRLQASRAEILPQSDVSEGSGFDLGPILGMGGGRGQAAAFYTNDRILRSLSAMEIIANHLASVQGRKNLVWVSDGFPLAIGSVMGPPSQEQRTYAVEIERTERALNNADVSVYAVDARGLSAPRQFSAAQSARAPSPSMSGSGKNRIPAPPRAASQPISNRRDSMIELADRTGGRAYYNTNDLTNAIREAVGDSEINYTLGYHPANTEMDGKFREIKIKVDRSGVNVRYRKGYLALGPATEDSKAIKEEMSSAVWSPLDASALPVTARVDFVNTPQPNMVHVLVQVDPTGLTLELKDGRYVGKVDVIMAQKDDRGNPVGQGAADTLSLNLKPETYAKVMKDGLVYQKTFPKESSASNLRLVVRDTGTGAIGSVTVPYKEIQ